MIYKLTAYQSCKRYEIFGVEYIPGVDNPADGLTKVKRNGVFNKVCHTASMKRTAEIWI